MLHALGFVRSSRVHCLQDSDFGKVTRRKPVIPGREITRSMGRDHRSGPTLGVGFLSSCNWGPSPDDGLDIVSIYDEGVVMNSAWLPNGFARRFSTEKKSGGVCGE